ncbi:MAG: hypothetical protein NVS2B15_00150 [Pseudarthrobacter sp.]
MSRSGPKTKAEQWWQASWNSRRNPATRSRAVSSLSARRSTVMNLGSLDLDFVPEIRPFRECGVRGYPALLLLLLHRPSLVPTAFLTSLRSAKKPRRWSP